MYIICNESQTEAFAGIVKTDTGLKQLWYPFPVDSGNYTLFRDKIIAEKAIKDCGFHGKIAVKL